MLYFDQVLTHIILTGPEDDDDSTACWDGDDLDRYRKTKKQNTGKIT